MSDPCGRYHDATVLVGTGREAENFDRVAEERDRRERVKDNPAILSPLWYQHGLMFPIARRFLVEYVDRRPVSRSWQDLDLAPGSRRCHGHSLAAVLILKRPHAEAAVQG